MLNEDIPGTSTASSSVGAANTLTRGLSQATTNVIYSLLGINHRSSIPLPPSRRANENLPSESPRSNGRLQNSAYQLNDLLGSYYTPNFSIQNHEEDSQLNSVIGLLSEQQQSMEDPQSSWTGQDAWDSSSFDFDEHSLDF